MRNTRLIVIGVVVVVFIAAGALIAFRGTGGGGATRNVTLNVTGAKMTPDRISAKQGDTLNLTVVNDHDAEVHLHGYDVHFEGAAGQPATRSIKLDKTGSFEIVLEASGTHLGELEVT